LLTGAGLKRWRYRACLKHFARGLLDFGVADRGKGVAKLKGMPAVRLWAEPVGSDVDDEEEAAKSSKTRLVPS